MLSVALTAEQSQLIDKVASDNGYESYQLRTTTGSTKGDNYLGVITSVEIQESERTLELILKSAQVGEFRNQMPVRQAYLREIYIYENVFTEFGKFQEKHGLTFPFQAYAKLYGSSAAEGNECLVLENLRYSGYRLWDRKTPMNPEHLAAVIKEYAKFHAVSLAMREKEPENFEKLAERVRNNVFADHINDKEKLTKYITTVMDNIWVIFDDDPVTTEVLKRFEKQLPDIFLEMAQQSEHVVIDHGDCWCNNLMFCYKDKDKPGLPTDVKIIDWQLSKISSPAMDLAYFFLIHSPKDVLYDYETYLKLYYETLSRNLREFSCDTEKVFPYSALIRQWKKNVKIGFYMCLMVMKLMLCDSEEAPDFSEISDSGKNVLDSFNFVTKSADTYKNRIRDLVNFSIEHGFL